MLLGVLGRAMWYEELLLTRSAASPVALWPKMLQPRPSYSAEDGKPRTFTSRSNLVLSQKTTART